MKCPDCGTEMKPLATSVFCPNDCDRKVTEWIDPEKTEKIYFIDPVFAPAGLQRPMGIPTVLPPDAVVDMGAMDDDELDEWIDSVFDDGTD